MQVRRRSKPVTGAALREGGLVAAAMVALAIGAGVLMAGAIESGASLASSIVAGLVPAVVGGLLAGGGVAWMRHRYETESQRRRELDRRRIESDRLQRALIEGLRGHAVYMLDPAGMVATWSAGARELMGYEAGEVLGRHVGLFHGGGTQGKEAVDGLLAEALRAGRAEAEGERVRKDGSRFYANAVVTPIHDDAGRHLGFAKVTRDISERFESQQRLELYTEELLEAKAALERQASELARTSRENIAARAAAEDANRAKSAFIANVSHEIRTPMTAILGFAELLGDADLSPADRTSHAQTIRASGEHLLAIINDILDLSKIEAGAAVIEQLPVRATDVLAECMTLFKPRFAEKGLGLGLEFDGPVPEWVSTDPTRVRQIVVNLLSNALKFTAAGEVRVVVGLDRDAGVLRVRVIDTGIGMDESAIARLFTPFVQADSSTTRRFGGTGLGLTISRRFARLLGGDLVVSSRPGEGSTFTLTIRTGGLDGVAMLTAPSTEPAAPPPTCVTPPLVSRPLRGQVLLADDGADNRRLISLILRKAGLEVVCVEDGAAAVEAAMNASGSASAGPFNLVLMDMQMPVMDGVMATTALRARGFAAPIVALTANAMSTDREKCLAAGCSDFLSKPITRAKLLTACSLWIGPDAARGRPRAA